MQQSDDNYNPIEFHRASKIEIEIAVTRKRTKGGKKRRDLTVAEFKKIAIPIK
jgi:hypothetical protein